MATPAEKQLLEAVLQNDLDGVKRMVEEKNIRVSLTNSKQQSLAHIAAENGYLPMFQYLISRDRELLQKTDDSNLTVLHVAVKKGFIEIVKYLIEEMRLDIFASENRFCGDTVVHMAAEEDQLAILKYFLEDKKVDVNVKDELGAPPLFLAAEMVRFRVVKYLVEEMKADTTITDFQADNILYRSAAAGDLSVPKYLLDERNIKFDVDWRNNFGRTILHTAARRNRIDFVKYFVEQKSAKYEIPDKLGDTPLHEAANYGHIDVVRYLVEKGASINCKNLQGRTPLDMAKDRLIIEYFKETMKTQRSRRNAFALEPTRHSSVASKFHQSGLLYSSMRRMVMDSPQITGHENGEGASSLEVSSPYLRSFLIIAGTVLMNSRNLVDANERDINLLSPQQIVCSKMDPLALNAVADDHNFSAP